MKKVSRRQLLSFMSLSPMALSQYGPIGILLSSFLNNTYAQAMGAEFPTTLVDIYMTGGPPRWLFDLPLNPNGNDPFVQNKTAITFFNEATKMGEYQHIKKGQFYMPRLWDAPIPTSDGKTVRMDNFLNHMLMIRGVNTGSDGHELNADREYQPVAGSLTLSGLLADASLRPIPATTMRNTPYLSGTGLGRSVIGGSNPIVRLLDPFNSTGNFSFNGSASEKLIDQALQILESSVDAREIKYKSVFRDRLKAKQMFRRQFGNLSDVYNQLKNKYEKLMKDTLTDSRFDIGAGVDLGDFLTKGRLGGVTPEYYNLGGVKLVSDDDHALPDGFNLKAALNSGTYVNHLVTSFATTEFILKEKLSNAVSIGLSDLRNINIDAQFNGGKSRFYRVSNDAHETGAISTLLYFSKYYQSIGSCLNELVNVLKAQNMFQDTVLRIHGDFNRNARDDGSGSDHGWRGSCNSFISGKINETMIVGNCKATSGGRHKASWGEGAPVAELNNREVSTGNVVATAATLLGIKNPVQNSQSLLSNDGGVIKANVGTKNV